MKLISVAMAYRMFKPLGGLALVLMMAACSFESSDGSDSLSSNATFRLILEVDPMALKKGQVVLLSTLSNHSDEVVSLLPWNTPLDASITGRFLTVQENIQESIRESVDEGIEARTQKNTSNDFVALPYQGIMAKRLPPTMDDYIRLAPDQSVSNVLDITKAYAFCAGQRYQIDLSQPMFSQDGTALTLLVVPVEFSTSSAFPACR